MRWMGLLVDSAGCCSRCPACHFWRQKLSPEAAKTQTGSTHQCFDPELSEQHKSTKHVDCNLKLLLMQAAGYIWQEGDVDWNLLTTLTYPAICSIAGLVAGMTSFADESFNYVDLLTAPSKCADISSLWAGMFGVGGGIIKMSFLCPTNHLRLSNHSLSAA